MIFQATFLVIPGNEPQVMKILFKHAEDAAKEPGVLLTRIYRSRSEPRRFSIFHELADLEAFKQHRTSLQYGGSIMTYLYSMIELDSLLMDTYELLTATISDDPDPPAKEIERE